MRNESLMLSYTEDEMLQLVKRLKFLVPERRECEIEREDGVDIDLNMRMWIKDWYANLLRTADADLLPVEDLKSECSAVADSQGVVTVEMPWKAVRPMEVRLEGWERSVTEFFAPDSTEARLQESEWTRGGSENPAAVAGDKELKLYSAAAGATPVVAKLRCVVWDNVHYVFPSSLLNQLGGLNPNCSLDFN